MGHLLLNSFDYVLAKEYDTILLRRFHPAQNSYVCSLLFDDRRKPTSHKAVHALYKELLELHEACIGAHTNDDCTTVEENVRVEICDSLFLLMVLDVALGGEDYYELPWAEEIVRGMGFVNVPDRHAIHDTVSDLGSLQSQNRSQVYPKIQRILTYFGMLATANRLTLGDLIVEIQRPHRWSKRKEAIVKRLADINDVSTGRSLPKEKWSWLKENQDRIAKVAIAVLEKVLEAF